MQINRGRWTHDPAAVGEGFVVFLIGFTFTRWWRIDAWLPTLLAMPRMLAELDEQPQRGMLGYRLALGPGGPLIVQYWRDVESLYEYASATDAAHRPAWTAFNRRARQHPGTVGIWHETYRVDAAESMFVDCPPLGVGAAVGAVPVTARKDRARDRLGRRD